MARDHTIKDGECLSQVAFENGFFWQALWSHPKNQELKAKRSSPFVLKAGDKVHIPDKQAKELSVASGKSHTFKLKGVPAKLKVKVRSGGQPVANQPYELDVDGTVLTGATDADGLVDVYVSPSASRATLTVGSGEEQRVYELALRHLEPETEPKGIQARLKNLGFYSGPVNGSFDEKTKEAIRAFQAANKLEVTGEDGADLQSKLKQVHGC
jgi:hypothetical protein